MTSPALSSVDGKYFQYIGSEYPKRQGKECYIIKVLSPDQWDNPKVPKYLVSFTRDYKRLRVSEKDLKFKI